VYNIFNWPAGLLMVANLRVFKHRFMKNIMPAGAPRPPEEVIAGAPPHTPLKGAKHP
jgi:hypothetical protein